MLTLHGTCALQRLEMTVKPYEQYYSQLETDFFEDRKAWEQERVELQTKAFSNEYDRCVVRPL